MANWNNEPDPTPQRRGFLAALSAALSPMTPPPDDDGGPLRPPKGVITAMVLALVAGAVYILSGGVGVASINDMMSASRSQYQSWLDDCIAQFGGYGTSAITEQSPTGSAATCQSLTQMTESDWDAFRSASIVVSLVFLAMGIAIVLAGFFLRNGAMWARRVIIAITIITVLAAMMLGMSSPLVLGATLLLMVVVVLCYIATGGLYFQRVHARKHA